jgi:glutathione S-transferase
MRALLRYRRIPFVWSALGSPRDVAVAAGLPPVILVLRFPDGRLMNDSTPLAHALEREHADRSVIPDDPALAYLSDLFEEFGDEWITKMMFHYRWCYAADRAFAQTWIVSSRDPTMEEGARRQAMQMFNDRQVGRMALVGCTEQNRPVIEDSYRLVIDTFDRHVRSLPFLLGSRPSLGDFGLYGQLQILSIDPTPAAEMRSRAPDLLCWLIWLDDALGRGRTVDRLDGAAARDACCPAEAHGRNLPAVPRRQRQSAAGRGARLRGGNSRSPLRPGAVPLPGQMLRRPAQATGGPVGRRPTTPRSDAGRGWLPVAPGLTAPGLATA